MHITIILLELKGVFFTIRVEGSWCVEDDEEKGIWFHLTEEILPKRLPW